MFHRQQYLSAAVLLLSLTVVSAQDLSTIDPALIINPPEGIDYPGCFKDLVTADRNGDGVVRQSEYLGFVQEYGKRKCFTTDALTLEQSAVFNALACICQSREGSSPDCCLGNNAQLPHAGALTPGTRSEEEALYLTAVCVWTDATIDSECPPQILDRGTPPPVIITPVQADAMAAGLGGLPDGSRWAIVMAIIAGLLLLLLLCCCCCVLRNSRAKHLQDEEEDEERVVTTKNIPGAGSNNKNGGGDNNDNNGMGPKDGDYPNGNNGGHDVEQPLDRSTEPSEELEPDEVSPYAAAVPPMDNDDDSDYEGKSRNGGHNADEDEPVYDDDANARNNYAPDDDSEDGEGRARRGQNFANDENDPDGRRIRGYGELPENNRNPEKVNLRSPPPKDPNDPDEWDQPGRDINFPKPEPDEYSAQEFDPYNPDGGVHIPQHPPRTPTDPFNRDWQRGKPEIPDDTDARKHRIQAGLGEGEVWDKLANTDDQSVSTRGNRGGTDVFDWVVQSALGVLDKNDEQSHLKDDNSTSVP